MSDSVGEHEGSEEQPERLPTSEVALRWSMVLLALLAVGLTGVMCVLGIRGEINWQRSEASSDRLFLIMEIEQRGLAWEHVGRVGGLAVEGVEAEALVCTRTSVRYYFWEGESEGLNTRYCECYTRNEGRLTYLGGQDCP